MYTEEWKRMGSIVDGNLHGKENVRAVVGDRKWEETGIREWEREYKMGRDRD